MVTPILWISTWESEDDMELDGRWADLTLVVPIGYGPILRSLNQFSPLCFETLPKTEDRKNWNAGDGGSSGSWVGGGIFSSCPCCI